MLVGTLLVPALALAASCGLGAGAYAPFFLLLLLGLIVMSAGFPPGHAAAQGATFTYNHLLAGAVPAHHPQGGAAGGAGAGLPGRSGGAALLRGAAGARWPPRPWRGWSLLAVSVLAARPRGQAVDGQTVLDGVPEAWERTADDLDRGRGPTRGR